MAIEKNLSESLLSSVVTNTRYATYSEELQRRRTWAEVTDILRDMHIKRYPQLKDEITDVFDNLVRYKKVLPSMRSVQFAGLPIELKHNRIYNCAFDGANHIKFFSETLFLLLGGTGTGFSVQSHHVDELPSIKQPRTDVEPYKYLVQDSIEGWADAILALMKTYTEEDSYPIRFDLRDIREKGAPIKKTGGKAPGPDKLKIALENVEKVLKDAAGRKLLEVEAYDITCYIADCVVSAGIRLSAMIAFFDKFDKFMINAKSDLPCSNYEVLSSENGQNTVKIWTAKSDEVYTNIYGSDDNSFVAFMDDGALNDIKKSFDDTKAKMNGSADKVPSPEYTMFYLPFWYVHPQRYRSNNSAVFERHNTTKQEFDLVFDVLANSLSGEPGAMHTNNRDVLANPCNEAALRMKQFCNLTTIDSKNIKTQQEFNKLARAATLIGTLQAGYTDFHYLRPEWRQTTEEDRLLGVSMTNLAYRSIESLDMAEAAREMKEANAKYAEIIGINPAARIGNIKPEGTTTLLTGNHGAGVHGVYGDYFIRTIRINKHDGIYPYLMKVMPDLMEDEMFDPENKAVLSIPVKSPEGVITRHENIEDFLNRVVHIHKTWISESHRYGDNKHNVSATIYVKPDEWEWLREWMWDNRNNYNGLAALPHSGGNYKQAPLQDINKEQFEEMYAKLVEIDESAINETEDNTALVDNLACVGDNCQI